MMEALLATSVFLDISEDEWTTECWVPIVAMLAVAISPMFRKPALVACISVAVTAYPQMANHMYLWLWMTLWTLAGLENDVSMLAGGVYLAAGFHKINTAFLSAELGCTTNFAKRMAVAYLGVEKGKAMEYFSNTLHFTDDTWWWAAVICIVIEVVAGVIIMVGNSKWKRWSALGVFAALHAPTAMISFYDFGSCAMCSMMSLVPVAVAAQKQANEDKDGKLADTLLWETRKLVLFYCLPNVLVAYFFNAVTMLRGFVFLVTIIPLVVTAFNPPAHRELLNEKTHTNLGRRIFAAVVVLLYASGPYLGFSTGGCFTMFSNLRVFPDGQTNHIFIPRAYPGLQGDILQITDIHPPKPKLMEHLLTARPYPIKVGKSAPRWFLQMVTLHVQTIPGAEDFQIQGVRPDVLPPTSSGANRDEFEIAQKVVPYGWWQKLMPFHFRFLKKKAKCQW